MDAPKRVFVPLNVESSLVDVSDGCRVKGLGSYYVPEDLADRHKRERDMLLNAGKVVVEALERHQARGGTDDSFGALHTMRAAIAECEKDSP